MLKRKQTPPILVKSRGNSFKDIHRNETKSRSLTSLTVRNMKTNKIILDVTIMMDYITRITNQIISKA